MNLADELRPVCEKCGKLVDEFRVTQSLFRDTYSFEARCHGEVEVMEEIPRKALLSALGVERGVAFRKKIA